MSGLLAAAENADGIMRFIACPTCWALLLGSLGLWLLIPGGVLTAWCILFFRDPHRMTPTRDGLVVSPADGLVVSVARGYLHRGVPFLDLAANQVEFAQQLKEVTAPAFAKVGLALETVTVQNVSFLPATTADAPAMAPCKAPGRVNCPSTSSAAP